MQIFDLMYLIGEVQLRQMRVKHKKCPRLVRDTVHVTQCTREYEMDTEDEMDYRRGWVKPNETRMLMEIFYELALYLPVLTKS